MAHSGSDSVNRFGRVLARALDELESRQREIDDLNVFPVADGDTGRNMVMTLRGLVGALDALKGSLGPVDLQEIDRDLVVKAVARAALGSAHGNSGVILSQLIRGAAKELGSTQGRKISPHLLGRAMRGAAEQGLASIPEPREGTILTVARDIAEALEAAHPEPVLIPDDIPHAEQDALLADALAIAVRAGTESVDRGPDLLDVLREKGVVDAGGYGLVVLIAGAHAELAGLAAADLPHRVPAGGVPEREAADERFPYCVNFTVAGEGMDPQAQARRLEAAGIGDSVLVVGDSEMIRVHVHTDDPAAARELFEQVGRIEGFEQEDMNEQIRLRDRRLGGEPSTHLLLVAHDEGVAEMLELDGVTVVTVGSQEDGDGAKVIAAAKALQPLGCLVVTTSDATRDLVGSVLAGGALSAEMVAAPNLGAALLALSSDGGWVPEDPPSLGADRLGRMLGSLRTAAVRMGDREAGDESDVVVVIDGAAWTAETVEGAIAFAASRFDQGAFVTAVLDHSAGVDTAEVEGLFGELDLSHAHLGGWVCVMAAEG